MTRAWLRRTSPAWTVAAIAVIGVAACTHSGSPAASRSAQPASSSTADPGLALQSEFARVVRQVLPSVVEIKTASGLGSGVVLDGRGDIVTNAHVTGTSRTFQVSLAESATTYPGVLVGVFAPDDLAVIRVRSSARLHPATLGDSSALRTGNIVMAIGNPLGLASSVTEGIVSALGRTVTEPQGADSPGATIPDTVQTSAPINPGNSGGALVDIRGHVVGIPTLAAIDQQVGAGSAAPGIGFAISSNIVRRIAGQLITSGRVTKSGRAALGVAARTVTDATGNPAGVAVASVVPGGPAAKAGIKAGDVITKLGSTSITSTQDLADVLATMSAGQRATVTFHPGAASATRTVTLVLGDLANG